MGEILQYLFWAWRQQWDLHPALQNTLPSHQVSGSVKSHPILIFVSLFITLKGFCARAAFISPYFGGCCCPFHLKMAPKPFITTLICGSILKLHSSSSPVFPLFVCLFFFSSCSVRLRYTTLRAKFCSTEVWSWPGKNKFALACAKVLAQKICVVLFLHCCVWRM